MTLRKTGGFNDGTSGPFTLNMKKSESGGLDGGRKTAFQRKLLHQFIIFGVNTGIRVQGILNLKWEDVQLRDKKNDWVGKSVEKKWGKDFFNSLD